MHEFIGRLTSLARVARAFRVRCVLQVWEVMRRNSRLEEKDLERKRRAEWVRLKQLEDPQLAMYASVRSLDTSKESNSAESLRAYKM